MTKQPKIDAETEYNTSQLAKLLKMTTGYLRQELTAGHLPARKFGPMWVIKGRDVLTWLERRPGKSGRWAQVEDSSE